MLSATNLLLTILVLAISILAMAVGVILSNKPLKGSCGGLNRAMGEDCEICGKRETCERAEKEQRM